MRGLSGERGESHKHNESMVCLKIMKLGAKKSKRILQTSRKRWFLPKLPSYLATKLMGYQANKDDDRTAF